LIVFVLCLAAVPAYAQQPTPSQTAIQIDNVINQWAQTIESQAQNLKAAQEKIDDKDKQIADLKKQLEEAKAAQVKPDPAKQ
jgi:septal ring factor EnvC (AmiA/AmiB activator)